MDRRRTETRSSRYSDHKYHSRSRPRARSYSKSPRRDSSPPKTEAAPRNTLSQYIQNVTKIVDAESRKANAVSGGIVDEKVLMVSGLPGDLRDAQYQNAINLLMHYLKLTTTSGFACVKVSFTSDPSVINAEFRSIEETNNALSLDGLNIMNTTIHVSRTKRYNGSETTHIAINPNCLLELVTGYRPKEYLDYLEQMGRYLMQEHEINNNLSNGTEKQNHQNNDILEVAYNLENCILLKNIPTPYEEFEIYNICEPFGDVKGLYLLKVRGEFQGEAVVEYFTTTNYQMAMEGLKDLPLDPPTGNVLLQVDKPPADWPAFPMPLSIISNPSPVLRIGNIISSDDLQTQESYEALIADLLEGFNKFGTVKSYALPVPKNGQYNCDGLGYVFIQYSSLSESAKATRVLRLQTYNNHQLHVDYYPEHLFLKKEYGQAGELI